MIIPYILLQVSPADFESAMLLREQKHHAAPHVPTPPEQAGLFPGTFYLVGVDDRHRRTYRKYEGAATAASGGDDVEMKNGH